MGLHCSCGKSGRRQRFRHISHPGDPREQAFFADIGTTLIDVPSDLTAITGIACARISSVSEMAERQRRGQARRSDTHGRGRVSAAAVGHEAVGDIHKGKQTFYDMATAVKRNVNYVNAGSFEDTIAVCPV